MRHVVIALLTLALCGLSHAETLNQPLPCIDDDNFFPMGNRWVRDPGADRPDILVYHSSTGPTRTGGTPLSANESRDAVRASFEVWSAARCTATKLPNIQVTVEPGLFNGSGSGDEIVGGQLISSINLISWETDDDGVLDAGTVGITIASFYRETGYVVDADMIFNDRDYQWRIQTSNGNRGCSRTETGCYDIGSVALHEAGHFLGLGHIRCGEAIMFPEGSGTGTAEGLSDHETNGVCSLYPPRSTSLTTTSDTWEACSGDGNCPSGTACVKPLGINDYGMCAPMCQPGSGQCGEGFFCATETVGLTGNQMSFCKPGIENLEEFGGLCSLCANGADCLSGLCIGDGTRSYCAERCGPEGQCSDGFSCLELNDGTQGCWPNDTSVCESENFGDLNELCLEGEDISNPSFYNPCGPGLVCFAFKPRCSFTRGTCMLYCDPDNPCSDPNLSCCYGVDEGGNCLGPSTERRFGGCFDLRDEGENCAAPEQSICGPGQGCFFFEQPTLATCYQRCSDANDCQPSQVCSTFQDQACDESFGLCCEAGQPGCEPRLADPGQALGTLCRSNADCDSGVCITYGATSACSRSCEPLTQVGCPEGSDVDGDGIDDLTLTCIEGLDGGFCWPNGGAVSSPGTDDAVSSGAESGCACDGSGSNGVWFGTLMLWACYSALRRRKGRLARALVQRSEHNSLL